MSPLKTIIVLLCSSLISAHAAIRAEDYVPLLPTGTSLSMLAQEMDGSKLILRYNSEQLALPASTQKVVTALAAILELGPEYRFETKMETQAKVTDGVLKGALIVRFSGDPTLTRQQIKQMLQELKRQGIKTITGDLLLDTSVFASHDKAPGWSWNNLTHCYNAPPSAAIVDRNCFAVVIKQPKKGNSLVTTEVAAHFPITVSNNIQIVAKKTAATKYCELDVEAINNQHYRLSGCLAELKKPITLSFSIQDGSAYVGDVLKYELAQAGIKFSGKVKQETVNAAKTRVLAKTQSVPLPQLLTVMLKQSDNMIADTLFRTMGQRYYQVPGTWRSGGDAVRDILRKKAGIDLDNAVIADGSGLSRNNLISADAMMQVLHYIARNDKQLQLIAMMPVAGQDGTLRTRKSLQNAGLDGKISAKTGALQGVYNLAGFMTTIDGKRIAFVQLLSGYSPERDASASGKPSLGAFETAIYQDLYLAN